jgi:hypothetical protein
MQVSLFYIDQILLNPDKDYDELYCRLLDCSVSYVPIVRVFGSLPDGQKACLFIHGHFPYMFVPYSPPNNPNFDIDTVISSILIFLNKTLEKMLSSSIRNVLKTGRENENELEILPSGVVSVFYPSRPLIHSSLSPVSNKLPDKSFVHYVPSGIYFPFVPSLNPISLEAKSENPLTRKPYLKSGSDPRPFLKFIFRIFIYLFILLDIFVQTTKAHGLLMLNLLKDVSFTVIAMKIDYFLSFIFLTQQLFAMYAT